MFKLSAIMTAGLLVLFSPLLSFAQSSNDVMDQALQDYDAHHYDKAKKEFSQVLAREPGNLTAHYHLGILLIQSDPKQAIVHLLYVANSPVRAPGIKAALARAYQTAGMYTKSLPLWRELHAQHPENRSYAFQYAIALQNAGNDQEARHLYEALIATGDANYVDRSRYQLGLMLSDLGSYNLAAEQFRAISTNSAYAKPAHDYLKALAPATRPLNVYLSGEYFYNDNPGASSAIHLGTAPVQNEASQGSTWLASLSTRQFEFTPHWRARLSYMFYGTFYLRTIARRNDFVGQYLNPELSFHPNARTSLAIKGNLERYDFSHQWLNDNYGLTVTGTWKPSPSQAYRVLAAYMNKRYTDHYQGISLQYLNADAYSLGLGTTLSNAAWKSSLKLDYTYTDERTNKGNDPTIVGLKSQDSRYREQAIRASAVLPLPFINKRLKLIPDFSYAYRNYPNVQSGALYTDIPGQLMQVRQTDWSVKLQALVWKKYNLTLSAGYEDYRSAAQTSILTYSYHRYFGQISAYY
jgi:hypothetical protein